jgi:hypothetical protein
VPITVADDFGPRERSWLWMAGDLRTVDALARLRLAGKRLGFEVRLTPTEELIELLELVGLVEVLWKPEEREEPLGVEEEGQLGDAAA